MVDVDFLYLYFLYLLKQLQSLNSVKVDCLFPAFGFIQVHIFLHLLVAGRGKTKHDDRFIHFCPQSELIIISDK